MSGAFSFFYFFGLRFSGECVMYFLNVFEWV